MQANRRDFLAATGIGAVALTARTRQSVAANAAERITVGVIGPGGMGLNHVRNLADRSDVRIAAVCDVDSERAGRAAEHVQKVTGTAPAITGDLRTILDNRAIDAVFIATPDHWHAPATILALDAGKHVYVEKPCCHNVREGRLMIEAVERSGKTLQVGTQSRSTDVVSEAMQRIKEGEIGEVLVAKAWNSQRRGSIGRSQPSSPPPQLDFDTWLGPARATDYRSNLLHGVWRWWYDFGCGDMGNDGVHDIDVALWGLNVESHPERISCLGGKYFFDDDQQFPDTQYAVFEYNPDGGPGKRRQLIFEQRIWTPYTLEGYENGAAFYGTRGQLIIGHTVGWKLYGERNKLLAERSGPADLVAHHDNFLECIRNSSRQTNADIHVGHRSAALVHLANISARVNHTLEFDSNNEQITNHETANTLLTRKYRAGHWSVPREANS